MTPPSVGIRIADATDVPGIALLAAQTFTLACPPTVTPDDVEEFVTANLSASHIAAWIADPEVTVWVAATDSEETPIAYVKTRLAAVEDEEIAPQLPAGPIFEINKFYVAANAHHTGVAARLMSAVLTAAAARGARTAWLGVNASNERAMRFYTKMGFARCGERTFVVGSQRHHDFLMLKQLPPDARAIKPAGE
ncbi:GNAT family N-acetyltransferase [Rarobacter incanus]|uniref:Ribosomal protein S18 acetylase RimI-like enzyme n=1 Tax=Rarobacter incanus TaxID=153494 RepID=A0A542SMQ9_9MICO|nr:N-acetyltransferase [Rarobacter incanus]TQK75775.1 ribosomal protein S18 acetylase RimI-like enzyme [Rarobacter incanus]